MTKETIKIPDLGGGEGVEVIEVCVAVGDVVEQEDSLLVLESDKASMEVPAPKSGKVVSIAMSVGDSVSEGDAILELEVAEGSDEPASESAAESAPDSTRQPSKRQPLTTTLTVVTILLVLCSLRRQRSAPKPLRCQMLAVVKVSKLSNCALPKAMR